MSRFLLLCVVIIAAFAVSPGNTQSASAHANTVILPLRFEQNDGQVAAPVRFVAHSRAGSIYLTDDAASLTFGSSTFTMRVVGGRTTRPTGADALSTRTNYFIGRDPAGWHTNVPSYNRIIYSSVLEGIDLVFHGTDAKLEYDFVVAPGTRPDDVAFAIDGAENLRLDESGALVINTASGDFVQQQPIAYQVAADATRMTVPARYRLDHGHVGFEVGRYDETRKLVIDPILTFSTYIGASGSDRVWAMAVDSSGNSYLGGITTSTSFPTKSPYQSSSAGSSDCVIVKLGPAGSSLVYSTYLGGSSSDQVEAIAVDSSGNVYVTGETYSTDFPTQSPYQSSNAGYADVFVTKLSPSGSTLSYSTYLGGSSTDYGLGISVDSGGNAYVGGSTTSSDFPTQSAYQSSLAGSYDAFVTKLSASGSALTYSTYLGGTADDWGRGMAVDSGGSAYIVGYTGSTGFPTQSPYQASHAGGSFDVFVTKLSSSGSTLDYSSYFGGNGADSVDDIAVDSTGAFYIVGATASTNFPTKNAIQGTKSGGTDAFVTKFASGGSALVYSTYLGGNGDDYSRAVAINSTGLAVVGETKSTDFPLKSAYQTSNGGFNDAFLTQIDSSFALAFSTYLGGSGDDQAFGVGLDSLGGVYVSGYTNSSNYPTKSAYQSSYAGNEDIFVSRFGVPLSSLTPSTVTVPPKQTVTFTASGGVGSYTYSVTTNNSGATIGATTGVYKAGATGNVTDVVEVKDSGGDSLTATVSVGPGVSISPTTASVTPKGSASFTATGGLGAGFTYSVSTNNSGASINTGTGAYTAGAIGSVSDVVTVTDPLGNTATATVTVGPGVSVTPPTSTVAPKGAIAFTASGGTDAGFIWSMPTNNSGGSIDSDSGAYLAGATGSVTDIVGVADSLGNAATATANVGLGVTIIPSTITLAVNATKVFVATGGSGAGYVWSLSANPSGGTIDPSSGSYKAGATPGVTDVVDVADALGNKATAQVKVELIVITPTTPTTAPRGSIAFSAAGGTGEFAWALSSNLSGGSINASTGSYVAGPKGEVTDTVTVTDSHGDKASVDIKVSSAIAIKPIDPTTATTGHISFTATGGSGSGYKWSISDNSSGGTIDASTGEYVAGTVVDVTDWIRVDDGLGNSAMTSVHVTPTPVPKEESKGCGCSASSVTDPFGESVPWLLVAWLTLTRRRSRPKSLNR